MEFTEMTQLPAEIYAPRACHVIDLPPGTFGTEYARILRKAVLVCIACRIDDGEPRPPSQLLTMLCEVSVKELDQIIGWLIRAGLLAFHPETGFSLPTYQEKHP